MRPLKRIIHIDFHTMPGIYNFNEKWDAEVFAEILQKANVKYINAFCKCNIGFAYYPTKIGIPYPNMKGDMFGDLLRECHKRDIGVSAYFNVGIDHEHARIFKDWCVVQKNGQIIGDNKLDSFCRLMCYNTGYRDYITSMVKEVISNYDVDGVFLDCFDVRPCYGNECNEGMIAKNLNPLDDNDRFLFAKESYIDLCTKLQSIIGTEKYLYINGWRDFVDIPVMKDINTHIEIEALPDSMGYDYFGTNVAYARKLKDKVLYMTGRFQNSWGDFGGFKGKNSLENDMWDAVMNGVEISIGDHMHPAENLDSTIYKAVKEIYADAEKYEKWTKNAIFKSDIGVITDKKVYLDKYKGISRMLGELKYSFDFLDEDMVFSQYKVLIMPDDMHVTPKLKLKIEKHLADKKGLLCTGEGGLNENGADLALENIGFIYDGIDNSNSSYFQMRTKNENDKLNCFRWSMYNPGILLKSKPEAEIIADYIKPYFNKHWDGFHGYVYTPPEKTTKHAACICNKNIYYICFKVFKAYFEKAMSAHKELVDYCLKRLLPDPLLKCVNLPSTSRVTLTENDNYVLVHVKVTFPERRGCADIIEEHQFIPSQGVIYVKGQYKKAFTGLDKIFIKLENEDDYTKIILPEIKGYLMVVLEK